MRTGDVGQRSRNGSQQRKVIRRTVPRKEVLVVGVVDDVVDGGFANGVQVPDLVSLSGDLRLIELCVFLVVNRKTGVEQQLIGVRPGPTRHVDEAGRRHLDGGRV